MEDLKGDFHEVLIGSPPNQRAAPRAPPLPQEWEIRADPQGRPYFINHTQRYSTYQDPRLPPVVGVATERAEVH